MVPRIRYETSNQSTTGKMENEKITSDIEDCTSKSNVKNIQQLAAVPNISKMGDKLTGRAMTKLDIFNKKATRKTDLPSLSTALLMSNDSGKPLSSRKRIESLNKNKGTEKMDYNFSTSEMFSDGQGESPNSLQSFPLFTGSDKPARNSVPSVANSRYNTIDKENFIADRNESGNKRRKLDAIGNRNELAKSMKKKLDMFPERAVKKSDLPCLSSVLSKGNDSGRLSSLHKKIKKSKYKFISQSRNSKSTHQCIKKNKSIQKRNCDSSTSDTFSEDLSDSANSLRKLASFTDCDKPVSNISPLVVNLVSPEYSSFKAIDEDNFVVEINESGNEREKKKRIRNKFTEIEPKSLSKYSIDHKSEYQRNIGINCNRNDDLKLADLFNDIENKTVFKSVRSISTLSRQSSESLEELLTDSSNVVSQLSNYSSEISLTFPESKLTSPISVGNRWSAFHTSQSAYLKRKMALLHKKRSERKSMFTFKLCNLVIEDLSSLGPVSGSPVNPNDEYTPNHESQTNNNQKENQLEIPFSPKQQNSSENLEEHFLEINPIKSTKSDATTKFAKRRYPFDQSPNLYDTERNETYTVDGTGKSMNIDGSQIASTVPSLCASMDQYSSQSQSTVNSLTENSTKRSPNNFWNDSYEVQNFVREWLNDENRSNNKTPKEQMGKNQYLLKRRRLFWDGINEIQDDSVVQKQIIDSGSEILLSNYSSEFDEAYKIRGFLPMSNLSH